MQIKEGKIFVKKNVTFCLTAWNVCLLAPRAARICWCLSFRTAILRGFGQQDPTLLKYFLMSIFHFFSLNNFLEKEILNMKLKSAKSKFLHNLCMHMYFLFGFLTFLSEFLIRIEVCRIWIRPSRKTGS